VADSTLDEVYGCIPYDGPPVSLEEMDEAVEKWFKEKWEKETRGEIP
jgi:hypothetical protein